MTETPNLPGTQRVFSPDAEPEGELESMRMWVWFAVKQAGGKIVVSYDEFFTCKDGATLRWHIDPVTCALTISADDA